MAAKKLKFEEAMQRLQEIVGKLESGEVSLEESMKLLRKGQSFLPSVTSCWTKRNSR